MVGYRLGSKTLLFTVETVATRYPRYQLRKLRDGFFFAPSSGFKGWSDMVLECLSLRKKNWETFRKSKKKYIWLDAIRKVR